jgi:hypothetical protein
MCSNLGPLTGFSPLLQMNRQSSRTKKLTRKAMDAAESMALQQKQQEHQEESKESEASQESEASEAGESESESDASTNSPRRSRVLSANIIEASESQNMPAGRESASGSGRPQKRKAAQTEPAVDMLSTTNYAASGVPDERLAGGFSHSAMFDFVALGADVFDAQLQQFFFNK